MEWTTQYPTDLDTTVTQMKTLSNESAEGAGDGDDTDVTQMHALRDAVIQLETIVGSDNLEVGSLRAQALNETWDYLDLNMPTAAGAPEALYQFDGTADSLNDRSGNSHTLSRTGNAIYQSVHGKLGHQFDIGTYMDAAVSAGLQTTGAMTWEIVQNLLSVPPTQARYMMSIAGAGEALATNFLGGIKISTACVPSWVHEYGAAGTDNIVAFDTVIPPGINRMLTFTRDAAGTDVNLYTDGSAVFNITSIAPTGGTSSFLRVGGPASAVGALHQGLIFSIRITMEEFTPAQVLESYRRVRGLY